jgi:hypothetical protein
MLEDPNAKPGGNGQSGQLSAEQLEFMLKVLRLIQDEQNVWLCWGSFWGGIMMRRIDPQTGKLSTTDTTLHNLARRPRTGPAETPPQSGAIEAPFIIRHDGWWYLFASFDFCCRGAKSTYNIRVGRSQNVTGPYVDKDGVPMLEGGGSIVIEATTPNWRGPGHEDRDRGAVGRRGEGRPGRGGRRRRRVRPPDHDGPPAAFFFFPEETASFTACPIRSISFSNSDRFRWLEPAISTCVSPFFSIILTQTRRWDMKKVI